MKNYTGELTIHNPERYPIDINKITTLDDVKYLLLATLDTGNPSHKLFLSKDCTYFDKLKHLICDGCEV